MEMSAETYEQMGAPITRAAFGRVCEAVIALEERVGRAEAVADVACGTGSATLGLADMVASQGSAGTVYAEDIDPRYLDLLRAKLGSHAAKERVVVRVGNALTLESFGDSSLDVLVSVAGLPWVFEKREERVQALKAVHRVLRGGGLFVCTTWLMPNCTLEELPLSRDKDAVAEFREAGWAADTLAISQCEMPEGGPHFSHARIFSIYK